MRSTIKWLALLAAVVLVAATAAFAGKPAPPPPTGPWDIAYGSETVTKGDLTLVQADGTGSYVVYTAPTPHYVRFPDWSHDGKYVSFNVVLVEGRVLEVATLKTCLLHSPHGTSPQPLKFHPSFPSADGRYVASWTNWSNLGYDLFIAEFRFREGNCDILWIENMTPEQLPEDFWGTAWSPVGNASATQLATLVRNYSEQLWALRIYDIVTGPDGHLDLAGTYKDYPLDPSLDYNGGSGGGTGPSLQWSPDPNVLGILARGIPDGGTTKNFDVFSIDISTGVAVMKRLTNTAANEYYFDFRANGDGIVAGNEGGIYLFPTNGDPICIAPADRKKQPLDPAWNPTQLHN